MNVYNQIYFALTKYQKQPNCLSIKWMDKPIVAYVFNNRESRIDICVITMNYSECEMIMLKCLSVEWRWGEATRWIINGHGKYLGEWACPSSWWWRWFYGCMDMSKYQVVCINIYICICIYIYIYIYTHTQFIVHPFIKQ